MKKDLHPTYHKQAKINCACGNEFIIGSTQEKIEVETCSNCHPFYTGKERGAVRGGRVEKFESRLQKKSDYKNKATRVAEKKEKKAASTEDSGAGKDEKKIEE